MSTRRQPTTVPEQIADIYEQLRRIHSGTSIVGGEVIVTSGGNGATGPAGPAGPAGADGADGAAGAPGLPGPVVWARFFATMGS